MKWAITMRQYIVFTTIMILCSILASGSLLDENIVYYSFDSTNVSGTTVYDLSVHSHDGTSVGADLNVPGVLGQSVYCGGGTDHIEVGYGNGAEISYGNITINMWTKASAIDNLFGSGTGVGNSLIINNDANNISFLTTDGTNNNIRYGNINIANNLTDSQWHMSTFIIVLNETGRWQYYYDGVNHTGLLVDDSFKSLASLAQNFWICGRNPSGGYSTTYIDEFSMWNRTLTQDEITILYNNGNATNFYLPKVVIIDPVNNTLTNKSLNISVVLTDTTILANLSLYRNGTFIEEIIDVYNTTVKFSFNSSYWLNGDNFINISFKDSDGESSVSINLFLDNESPTVNEWGFPADNNASLFYGNGTINFDIKVLDDNLDSFRIDIYNLTGHNVFNETVDISGNSYNYTGTTDFSWYYNYHLNTVITVNDTHGNIITDSRKFTFLNFNMYQCDSVNGTKGLNFTLVDEDTLSNLYGNVTGTINYSNSGYSKILSISKINVSNLVYCILPNGISFDGKIDLAYDSSGNNYPQRRYYDDSALITNVSQNIRLFLLLQTLGGYSYFKTIDNQDNAIPGVSILMSRIIGGVTYDIESTITDGSGVGSLFIDPDVTYQFTFTKSGYQNLIEDIKPVPGEIYSVIMVATGTNVSLSYGQGISFTFSPKNTPLKNLTQYNLSFDLISEYWGITNCSFSLYNGSTLLVNNDTLTNFNSSSCFVNIEFNTSNYTKITGYGVYELNSSVVITHTYTWSVHDFSTGEYSIKVFIDDVKNFTGAGFNKFTLMVIALAACIGITAYASTLGKKFKSPNILITIFLLGVYISSSFDMFNVDAGLITLGTIDMNQWIIFIILAIAGIGFMLGDYR